MAIDKVLSAITLEEDPEESQPLPINAPEDEPEDSQPLPALPIPISWCEPALPTLPANAPKAEPVHGAGAYVALAPKAESEAQQLFSAELERHSQRQKQELEQLFSDDDAPLSDLTNTPPAQLRKPVPSAQPSSEPTAQSSQKLCKKHARCAAPTSHKPTEPVKKRAKQAAQPDPDSPDVFAAAVQQCEQMCAAFDLTGTFGASVPNKQTACTSQGFGASYTPLNSSVLRIMGEQASRVVSRALETQPMPSGHLAQHKRAKAAAASEQKEHGAASAQKKDGAASEQKKHGAASVQKKDGAASEQKEDGASYHMEVSITYNSVCVCDIASLHMTSMHYLTKLCCNMFSQKLMEHHSWSMNDPWTS